MKNNQSINLKIYFLDETKFQFKMNQDSKINQMSFIPIRMVSRIDEVDLSGYRFSNLRFEFIYSFDLREK